jgi:hypothetical protein
MANKSVTEFGSSLSLRVTESAANTLTFAKIEGGVVNAAKVGWVVQKLHFSTSALSQMNSSGDTISIALTVSNKLTDLNVDNPGVIYVKVLQRVDLGVAATGIIHDLTFEVDFSTLQGNGLLILPNPLYIAVLGTGLAAATVALLRMYFYEISMQDSDYFNLVQSRQILINS